MRADLFTWQDEQEALKDLEAAQEARAEALRKLRCAPHGEVNARAERLRLATAEALRAEVYLDKVRGHQ